VPLGGATGEFIESGGPATLSGQTPHFPLPGHLVAVNSAGARYSVAVGKDGRFRLSLPGGTYQLAGFSPAFGGKDGCPSSTEPVHVATGRTTRGVLVICTFP
jgi:hypothetical protein